MNLRSDRNNLHPKEQPLADSVLRLIWREQRTSRADIARQMGLSRSTASEIVDRLLETGLVAEMGAGESSGGRRPIVLEFQDNARVILGVDLGATHVSVALTDLRGRILTWKEADYPVRTDPEGARRLVISLCDECLSGYEGGRQPLIRIGVAVPSPVDPRHPKWLSEVVIPAWGGQSGLEQLQEKYRVPLHIDNDANLGALAEHWWGVGQGVDDFVYIKMAHGIGAGYVLNGEIYRGASGVAGEFGHFSINPNGEECICGLKGCLATYVSAPALTNRVAVLAREFPRSILVGKKLTVEAIENAALAGDELAMKIVGEAAEYLGIAIAGWINLMNPRLVVLGGGLTRLGDLLLLPLRERARYSTLVRSAAPEIKTSALGPRAVALGAATLALQEALSDPDLVKNERTRTLHEPV